MNDLAWGPVLKTPFKSEANISVCLPFLYFDLPLLPGAKQSQYPLQSLSLENCYANAVLATGGTSVLC